MNIFALSKNVEEIAMWQVDKHCIKMPLESAMMLSSAHRYLDGKETIVKSKAGRNVKKYILNDERENILYGVSHLNHPCTKWTYETSENYKWHYNLLIAMLKEYTYRYGKNHACEKLLPFLKNLPKNINIGHQTPFVTAMPDECKVPGDSIQSYRNYYLMNKSHLWSWKGKINKREVPFWFKEWSQKVLESLSYGYT
jgi:hypothetical protein